MRQERISIRKWKSLRPGVRSNYNELAAAELAREYTANLENLTAQLKEAGEFQVEEICYVDPKQQLEPEKLSGNSKILENWGGDCLTELMYGFPVRKEDYLSDLRWRLWRFMESPDTWICIDGHDGRSSNAENDRGRMRGAER